MSLYSVSPFFVLWITLFDQAAIEYYNRQLDEDNQTYYIDKMNTLNGQIKEVLDRQQRKNQQVAKSNGKLQGKPSQNNPL